MARRYDSRTTIFSPEGRLYQVEYAMEAISHAGTAIGIVAKDGIILAAEKKVTSKLLEQELISNEKIYLINNNVAAAVAGITADANILINKCRVSAQKHLLTYNETIPVEQLVQTICDLKQGYTQYGGLRPFGVSFLYAGYDKDFNFQLYHSDPSGNYFGWKAHVIGNNHAAAQAILKTDYKEDMELSECADLAIKVLNKTMETTSITSDKLEFASVTLADGADGNKKVVFKVYTAAEMDVLLKKHQDMKQKEKEKEKEKEKK